MYKKFMNRKIINKRTYWNALLVHFTWPINKGLIIMPTHLVKEAVLHAARSVKLLARPVGKVV